MRIYISGPISNMPDGNRRAFSMASMQIDITGHESVSPHNNGVPASADWSERMRADVRMLLDCDAVAMLPGWENSRGANIERQLAVDLGMPVKPLAEWLP